MALSVSVLNSSRFPHLLCKSSHGHYYMGGPSNSAVIFSDMAEFQVFFNKLKSMKWDDYSISQYDLDVFTILNQELKFSIVDKIVQLD